VGIEIFNTKNTLIFPCEDKNITPLDFVPKMPSGRSSLLRWNLEQRKGMGVTWKFVQCMVKPNDVQSVVGRPMFQLSSEEMNLMESNDNDKQKSDSFNHDENPESFDAPKNSKKQPSTTVEDSDNEETPAVAEPTPNQSQNQSQNQPLLRSSRETIVSAPDPVVATPEPEVKATAPPVLKKKIIKKAAQPTA
jgi:hypothetical protein